MNIVYCLYYSSSLTIGIFLGGSFLTPINSIVADFLLQEDYAMCEPALHFARNFLRQVLHFQSNFSSVSIPNFAKKSAIFSKLVFVSFFIFYLTIIYVRGGPSQMVHLNIIGGGRFQKF